MSEHEIIMHAKKAFAIFRSSGMELKNKLSGILMEIIIIVFAISISIWLHNWSERTLDRKEEMEFLAGFRKDIQTDIENITKSREFYKNTLQGLKYFLKAGNEGSVNKDSIARYSWIFFSSTDLDPHIGRYEGLKSSGKFRIIENKELLNNIINFQETIVQRIQMLNEKYYQHTARLEVLVEQNVQLAKNGEITNAAVVLDRNDMKILLSTSVGIITGNIIGIHDEGLMKCNEIAGQIDKELR